MHNHARGRMSAARQCMMAQGAELGRCLPSWQQLRIVTHPATSTAATFCPASPPAMLHVSKDEELECSQTTACKQARQMTSIAADGGILRMAAKGLQNLPSGSQTFNVGGQPHDAVQQTPPPSPSPPATPPYHTITPHPTPPLPTPPHHHPSNPSTMNGTTGICQEICMSTVSCRCRLSPQHRVLAHRV